jgi:hypothetical protein
MMTNDQLFPTSWETQKVLLKDFYGFGKTELAVVFSSRLKQYKDNLSEDVYIEQADILDKIKEILNDSKKECSVHIDE